MLARLRALCIQIFRNHETAENLAADDQANDIGEYSSQSQGLILNIHQHHIWASHKLQKVPVLIFSL
jgi:hypothetical protein